tara:strand:- start:2758 stop:3699 length:942 start_codon:yes stop_codon:yes gene_type:complete
MMEVVSYKYSDVLPVSISKTLIGYINKDVSGSLLVVKDQEVFLFLLVRNKMKFKIGYFLHPPVSDGKKISRANEIKFFKKLTPFFKKEKLVDFVMPPLHLENFSHIPEKSFGHKLGIISLPLMARTEEEIFAAFKPVYRRHIRKASKVNVKIKFGLEYFDDFYSIYSEKLQQENAVYDSYESIKDIAFNSDNEIEVQCGVAYLDGEIEAGILNISDLSKAYYFYGGVSKNAHNGSFRLLHWELIKQYIDKGIEAYQLGGKRDGEMLTLKHERLASFKLGFGAIVEDGYHFVYVVNKIKYKLYQNLMKLKSKMK